MRQSSELRILQHFWQVMRLCYSPSFAQVAFTHRPHHTARRHKVACKIMKTHTKSRLNSYIYHAAQRCTEPHFHSVTYLYNTKQLLYMQTNHYARRTELMKYFQHQIGGQCLCPRNMQQVTFSGATKERMKTQHFIIISTCMQQKLITWTCNVFFKMDYFYFLQFSHCFFMQLCS